MKNTNILWKLYEYSSASIQLDKCEYIITVMS